MYRVAGLALLVFFAGLLAAYASIYFAHRKAQKLLAEVDTLRPGTTTVQDVERRLRRYGGEQFDAHSYYGYVGSDKRCVEPSPCLGRP